MPAIGSKTAGTHKLLNSPGVLLSYFALHNAPFTFNWGEVWTAGRKSSTGSLLQRNYDVVTLQNVASLSC